MSKVNLTKRVKVGGKDRYCPVAVAGNGRIKPEWVVVDGAEVRAPGGSYYIDWTQDSKRRREAVGTNATVAANRRVRKEAELRAQAQGIVLASEEQDGPLTPLIEAVAEYLEDVRLSKKPKTLAAYTTSTEYFQESCRKQYVEQIERRDMLQYAAYLRDEKELAPRTCWNKFNNVMSFLKIHKLNDIVNKNDWPKFTQQEVDIYEQEDLNILYASCTPHEMLWWNFFLMTGEREQEVIYTSWRDINLVQGTVSVRHKPEYGWTPKAYKEREIPLSDKLHKALTAIRPKNPGSALVFPTESGKPKMDFLHCLKACARRAGLSEDQFYLHKFRATFATWNLWEGVDLRTVQQWLGHADLESTMRYLKPSRGQAVRDKMNATFA